MLELKIETREKTDDVEALRLNGTIPAVIYGPKEESVPVKVNEREFTRVWEEAGSSAIVELIGVGDNKETLIHEVAWHPVRNTPIHIDFYCIERGKLLTVTVPFNFIGEAPVEKEGGIVVKVMYEIEVEVRPRDIPQSIDVDITLLTALDSNITIADLHLPDFIKLTSNDVTENVASVTQAKEEKVQEEERDIDDIEIEGKGKEESGDDSEEKQEEEKTN